MIRVYTSNGKSSYGIAELLLDSEDDLTSLSETPDMGIFAIVIDTGDIYCSNSKQEWVKMGAKERYKVKDGKWVKV